MAKVMAVFALVFGVVLIAVGCWMIHPGLGVVITGAASACLGIGGISVEFE